MAMEYYVYILESLKTGRHYVGVTKHPAQRLKQHNAGSVPSTKPFRPWRLLGADGCLNLTTARGIEKRLKRSRNRNSLERFLRRASLVPTSDPQGRSPDSHKGGRDSSFGGDRDC